MNPEYNSKIISQLYSNSNIIDILMEIEGTQDPIFIYPLLDAYLRTKEDYCFTILQYIKSNDLTDIIVEKLGDIRQYKGDVAQIIDLFNYQEKYIEEIINAAEEIFLDFYNYDQAIFNSSWGYFGSYDLERVLEYLKNSQKIPEYESYLDNLFFQKKLGKDFDTEILKYLFRINPSKQVLKFIEQFDSIKKTEKEIILCRELVNSGWKNGKIPDLKKIIMEKGSSTAREILVKDEERKQKKIKEEEKKVVQAEQYNFQNSSLTENIFSLRKSINTKSLARDDCKFEILESTEILLRQSKTANTESELKDLCVDFRDIIKNISKSVNNHGFSEEKALELIPGADKSTLNGSVNQLYLFLLSRGVKVELDFWGLRKLMALLNLIAAHPNDSNELIKVLKEEGVYKDYENKNWETLHKNLLNRYLIFLTNFDKQFSSLNVSNVNLGT